METLQQPFAQPAQAESMREPAGVLGLRTETPDSSDAPKTVIPGPALALNVDSVIEQLSSSLANVNFNQARERVLRKLACEKLRDYLEDRLIQVAHELCARDSANLKNSFDLLPHISVSEFCSYLERDQQSADLIAAGKAIFKAEINCKKGSTIHTLITSNSVRGDLTPYYTIDYERDTDVFPATTSISLWADFFYEVPKDDLVIRQNKYGIDKTMSEKEVEFLIAEHHKLENLLNSLPELVSQSIYNGSEQCAIILGSISRDISFWKRLEIKANGLDNLQEVELEAYRPYLRELKEKLSERGIQAQVVTKYCSTFSAGTRNSDGHLLLIDLPRNALLENQTSFDKFESITCGVSKVAQAITQARQVDQESRSSIRNLAKEIIYKKLQQLAKEPNLDPVNYLILSPEYNDCFEDVKHDQKVTLDQNETAILKSFLSAKTCSSNHFGLGYAPPENSTLIYQGNSKFMCYPQNAGNSIELWQEVLNEHSIPFTTQNDGKIFVIPIQPLLDHDAREALATRQRRFLCTSTQSNDQVKSEVSAYQRVEKLLAGGLEEQMFESAKNAAFYCDIPLPAEKVNLTIGQKCKLFIKGELELPIAKHEFTCNNHLRLAEQIVCKKGLSTRLIVQRAKKSPKVALRITIPLAKIDS